MFVKLGQVLSTRADLVSDDVARELSHLQDHVKPASREEIAAVLEEELEAAVEDVFAEFDWEPVAAASIGQAYRAQLPSGETVIVKVQRPGRRRVGAARPRRARRSSRTRSRPARPGVPTTGSSTSPRSSATA